jgi:hypothetical protein
MRIVGIDFRDGILFVPEVLLAANAMKAGMAILRPLLAETGVEPIGKVVIGTVKGDIHDIGKNLVAMMLEGAGFEVFDLGINTDADSFLAALDEHKPDILGMSALLTTTMPYMKVVIQTLIARASATTTSCWSAARRSTRSSARASAPTRTAATRRSPPRPPRRLVARTGGVWSIRARAARACGALAADLRAVLARAGFDGTSRSSTCPPTFTTGPTDRHRAAATRCRPRRGRRCSSPTPTAAPGRARRAARRVSRRQRLPGAHCYEVFGAGVRALQNGARHLLLTDSSRALRRARVERLGLDRHPELRDTVLRLRTGGSCSSRRRPTPSSSARPRRRRPARARVRALATGRDGLRPRRCVAFARPSAGAACRGAGVSSSSSPGATSPRR